MKDFDKLVNSLIEATIDIADDNDSNNATTHYDLYMQEGEIDQVDDDFEGLLYQAIIKDMRVLQCEIGCFEEQDVSIVIKDDYLSEDNNYMEV